MPLLILGLVAFFVLAWFYRRRNGLTRACRWREDRRLAAEGERYFHCLSCGAELHLPAGQEPRRCARPAG